MIRRPPIFPLFPYTTLFRSYSYFIAGLRCYDIGDLTKPEEVAYFIPPQGGDLKKFGSYDRTVDNVFVEWDRNVIWCAADTDRKSTRLNSSHSQISYAVFCLQ